MKFVSFSYLNPRPRVGVRIGAVVIDLSAAAPLVFDSIDNVQWELIDILRGEPEGMGIEGAAEIAAAVLDQLGVSAIDEIETSQPIVSDLASGPLSIGGIEMLIPIEEVRFHAPLPRPASLRMFDAFEEHVETTARIRGRLIPPEWYDRPFFTFANAGSMYGPNADVHMPRTTALDYGLAVACVIGRAARDIAEEDAEAYIAGYTIVNDWIARDIERSELAVGSGLAKARDFATSLGPFLVTPDEIESRLLPDGRYNLSMVARVNGSERSRGNMRDIFYTFPQMIAQASRDATLYPGDVLVSGCVGTGCLLELTHAEGPWLTLDDEIELEIGGLGVLKNRVV